MAKKSGGIVGAFDNLPWIVKLIFALPGLDFLWAVYRIIKGAKKGNVIMLVMGIVWLLAGWAILWIIDIVCVVLFKKPTIFA